MLKVGDKVPEFKAKDEDGNEISLKNYWGKKIVLYFYPKDDTPTCTKQACNLRDNYKKLKKEGYEIFGVSTDNEKSHKKFIKKYDLPFKLIADPDKKLNELFGVWQEKTTFGKTYMGTVRTTFVINEKGIIEEIISKVVSAEHADQILHINAE
jgi:peroxiredoxin Q/BCP